MISPFRANVAQSDKGFEWFIHRANYITASKLSPAVKHLIAVGKRSCFKFIQSFSHFHRQGCIERVRYTFRRLKAEVVCMKKNTLQPALIPFSDRRPAGVTVIPCQGQAEMPSSTTRFRVRTASLLDTVVISWSTMEALDTSKASNATIRSWAPT